MPSSMEISLTNPLCYFVSGHFSKNIEPETGKLNNRIIRPCAFVKKS
jgi:hypothetical protein